MSKTANPPKPKKPKKPMGRVERKFRKMADKLSLTPPQLWDKLLSEGATQTQIAEKLNCTRQAVGFLAARMGYEFPGARIDLDEVVREKTKFQSFEDYVQEVWGDINQRQMADQLGVSISTVKRRIKEIEGE